MSIREIRELHKINKIFLLIVLISWIANLGFAAPSHAPLHQHAKPSHYPHQKKSSIKHTKNIHKKSSGKKHAGMLKPKHRVIKPNIVKKEESDLSKELSINPSPVMASNTPPSEPAKPKSFYRILTQPMTSDSMTAPTPPPVEHKIGLAASIEQRLVGFVHKTVSSLHYSSYKLGGSHIDTSQGIYIVDCSGYVDHTLRVVYPNAYLSLVGSSGVHKPNTSHYYNFFTNLSNDPNQFWSRIEDIEQLRPGDILVFRYKNMHGKPTGGHVMVVMNKPERDGSAYLVSVADSAASGHSEDTRHNHVSGVGIGTILLKVDPKTRQPSAYAWTFNSPWRNNVNFAMARPLEMDS